MFEHVCGGIAGHKVDYHLEKQDAALDSIHRTPIEHREESRAAFQGLREYGQWIAFATLLVILSIAAAGCSWSSRNASAKDWAKTQNNLGNALWTQAGRSEGAESVRLLNEAVAAYRGALKVYTREQFPQDWAATQNNLGNALRDQAGQSEGAEAVRLLNEPVAAHRDALKVYTREQFPQDWATTQNNLGNALSDQAETSEGAEAGRLSSDAVAACKSALTVWTAEDFPYSQSGHPQPGQSRGSASQSQTLTGGGSAQRPDSTCV